MNWTDEPGGSSLAQHNHAYDVPMPPSALPMLTVWAFSNERLPFAQNTLCFVRTFDLAFLHSPAIDYSSIVPLPFLLRSRFLDSSPENPHPRHALLLILADSRGTAPPGYLV